MQPPKENPFLGLKPYSEKDQLYGRDKDLFLMTDRIFCARTTLLFAGSGVGKTSFINAKIIPELNSQYASIIYHKEWAIGQPLENLLNSIAKHLPAADASPAVEVAAAVVAGSQDAPPVKPPVFDANNKLGCYLKKFISDEPGSEDDNRCLLILDQFEEVFQYHRGKNYFDLFITQLAEVINHKHCNVRVLFSMREEFLGELSVFDNRIPDLFSNYYRLKNPNKQGAKKIISRTCSLVDMPVDEKKLKLLVADLTTIETISATPTHDQNGDEGPQDSDIVAPPYLQIACRRLWERQFNSANSAKPAGETPEEKFLSDYKDGAAREMLKSFCEEILNGFNKSDRALIAEAFNYLVTKKGAKMAYALASLADHMGVKEERLESVLHRLSDDNSRILRESKGPDRALWYELYHDMYGKIIDEWRRTYRLQQKRESNAKLIMAAGVIIVIALVTVLTWQWLDRTQLRRGTLRNGDLSKQLSYLNAKQAYDDLKDTWHSGTKAKELWGDAWKRRALFGERTEDAPQAFLSFLKAAEAYPTDRTDPALLAEIRSYLSSDEYQPLLASYRLEIGVTTSPAFKPILTADGKMLVSIASDRQAFFWDTESYELKQKSRQLAVDYANQSTFYGAGPPSVFQHVQNQTVETGTQVQAATESLIGGIDNNKFCIWDAKTGEKLWESDPKTGPPSQTAKPLVTGNVSSYSEVYSQSVQRPSFSFNSDGRYFSTSNGLDSPLLYTFNNNKAELLLADLMRNVTKIKFSPDGHSIALVFNDGTAQLRKLDTNESRSLAIDGKSIRRIVFNSDGSRLLADMGEMKPAEIWNTAEGVRIKQIYASMGDQFFCPDNKTIGSILPINESNRTIIGIRFWDSEKDAVSIRAIKLDERIDYFINPNGKLLTIGVSGTARLWDLSPPNPQKLITDSARILVREISKNGQVVVTVNSNQNLTVWDAKELKEIKHFPLPTKFTTSRDVVFPGQRDPIDELVVSPTGKYVCLTNFFNFSLRKLEDNKEITSGRYENNPFVRTAAFSPDEEIFAVANQKYNITLWKQLDTTTPTPTTIPVHEDIYELVFSPDGKYLASIGGDGFNSRNVRIFEVKTATEMLPPTEGFTPNIALGRNGIMIGTIPNDDTAVLVWNIATGRSQKLWHDTSVTAVALNQDASNAITSTSNGTLQLWDTATGKPVASGTCSTRIRTLMMSEDGATVVALSDKWVHIHWINREAMKTAGEGALRYIDGREIAAPESLRILDSSGKRLRNMLPPVQDSLKVDVLDFSAKPTGDDPVGSAKDFFLIWTGKLALNFNENGRVTPIHPQ